MHSQLFYSCVTSQSTKVNLMLIFPSRKYTRYSHLNINNSTASFCPKGLWSRNFDLYRRGGKEKLHKKLVCFSAQVHIFMTSSPKVCLATVLYSLSSSLQFDINTLLAIAIRCIICPISEYSVNPVSGIF